MRPAPAPTTETLNESRITKRFAELKSKGKSALIAYITAGDPDLETSAKILEGLPKAGADIIELSFPFSDPMADGPILQEANQRALKAGSTLKKTLAMVKSFREQNTVTPVVLMGYFNPIYVFGVKRFLEAAKEAGIDGLIVVDLPPEEDQELCEPALKMGLNFIRLITPTSDAKRIEVLLKNASGFLYYVSIAGITGTKSANINHVEEALKLLRRHSNLPIAVGFGISTPEQAQKIANIADGAIIGSAIVSRIAERYGLQGQGRIDLVEDVLGYVETLAQAIHNR